MTIPVIILGAVGAGKTTIGRLLSNQLLLPFIDIDEQVADFLGEPVSSAMITRPEECENAQRTLACAALVQLGENPAVLVLPPAASTQHSVVQAILQAQKAGAFVVELTIDIAELARRMGLNAPRTAQLGAPRAMLAKMLATTHEHHATLANVSVTTVGHRIEQVLQEVLTAL